jgi:hypothetical protein
MLVGISDQCQKSTLANLMGERTPVACPVGAHLAQWVAKHAALDVGDQVVGLLPQQPIFRVTRPTLPGDPGLRAHVAFLFCHEAKRQLQHALGRRQIRQPQRPALAPLVALRSMDPPQARLHLLARCLA